MAGRRVNKRLKGILSTSIYLLFILIFAFLIVNYVVQKAQVIGVSMENTLYDKDQVLMDKLSYRFGDVKRFDLVVFPQQKKSGVYVIKRVIGLPGETVRIDDNGIIYINDKELKEDYGKERIKDRGNASSVIRLGSDEFFVLGDNRNDSIDSRFDDIGLVKERFIKGKVVFRLYPFNRIGVVK